MIRSEQQLERLSAGLTIGIHILIALCLIWLFHSTTTPIKTYIPVALEITAIPKPSAPIPAPKLPDAPKPIAAKQPVSPPKQTQKSSPKPEKTANTAVKTAADDPAKTSLNTPIPQSTTAAPQESTIPSESVTTLPHPGDRPGAIVKSSWAPTYPKTALNNEWEGTVEISVVVNPDGSIATLNILASSGHELLDQSFIQTIQSRYQFLPKRELSENKSDTLILKHEFKLE